jgi:hypothetical protein
MCVPRRPPFIDFVVQPTNRSLLDFEAQTKKLSWWFWCTNHQTRAVGFEAQTGKPSTTLVLRLNQETDHRFWGQTERNRRHWFWGQTSGNRLSGFEAKPLTNRRLWFWGSTKKPVLLATRPLDCPATEYPTYATILGPLHQVSYSCYGPHHCTSCHTCHLHTTRQANTILQWNKGKRKTKQNYPGFKFKHRQVNDSSQSNQETNHLVSHVSYLSRT